MADILHTFIHTFFHYSPGIVYVVKRSAKRSGSWKYKRLLSKWLIHYIHSFIHSFITARASYMLLNDPFINIRCSIDLRLICDVHVRTTCDVISIHDVHGWCTGTDVYHTLAILVWDRPKSFRYTYICTILYVTLRYSFAVTVKCDRGSCKQIRYHIRTHVRTYVIR